MMRLQTEVHLNDEAQEYVWVTVDEAFRPAIGHWAVEHGRFGGEFSFERMNGVDYRVLLE